MKIQSPWMGRIKGSAGNMTGCKVYDKNVMRAKAFDVNNPNTAAQQVQRGYFANLTKLVAGFTPDQLRTLFPSKPKAMSRRNALSKQLAEYNVMDGTEKIIDFAEIDTLGNAPTGKIPTLSVSAFQENIYFSYDISQVGSSEYNSTYPVLVVINATKKEFKMAISEDPLDAESVGIETPSNWEQTDTLNAFLLLTNLTNDNADFGSFIIKVRPEKKSN